jgi:hypothetical protein
MLPDRPRHLKLLLPSRSPNQLPIKTRHIRVCIVREEFDPADYSVVVKRRVNPPKPWRWKIYSPCLCA